MWVRAHLSVQLFRTARTFLSEALKHKQLFLLLLDFFVWIHQVTLVRLLLRKAVNSRSIKVSMFRCERTRWKCCQCRGERTFRCASLQTGREICSLPCVLRASMCFRWLSSSRYKTQYGRFAWDEDLGAIKRIDFTSFEGSSAGNVDDKYYSKVFI